MFSLHHAWRLTSARRASAPCEAPSVCDDNAADEAIADATAATLRERKHRPTALIARYCLCALALVVPGSLFILAALWALRVLRFGGAAREAPD